MSWHRIKALLLHSWYHTSHSKETQVDLVWYPVIQFFIFGLIAKVISQQSTAMAEVLLTEQTFNHLHGD